MHRFFGEYNNIFNDKIIIEEDNFHHLKVLRIEEDEEFEIVISNKVHIVKIESLEKDHVICKIIDIKDGENESNIEINLYQGLPKSDKLELIIQKSVELGVNKIIPFESSRTIVKWDNKKMEKKILRYNEIAKSAAKQSKRTIIPSVESLISFNELLDQIDDNNLSIIAYENFGENLKDVLNEYDNKIDNLDHKKIYNIIIGPEGGFSEKEVDEIRNRNCKVVNLGNRILRTETAAIAIIAMIQYEKGDINK